MLSTRAIADAVKEAVARLACSLRPDVRSALEQALRSETSERGRRVIEMLLENAAVAERDAAPLCQDTGTVWVWVEAGEDECVPAGLPEAIDAAVRDAYRESGLRMSVVKDALLDRTNTGDNTPALLDVSWRPGSGATVHVMLKGGGSDNASVVQMLPPSAGEDGVVDAVVRAVEAKGASACPPLVIGVGVGGTFDTVGKLSKRALLRPLDAPAADPRVRDLEARILVAVNATGIGPAGLGGSTTALGVRLVSAPSHIAALPVAVNLGCCAMRATSVEVRGA
ncbi:fumarate hydratase [Coriobacteriia bacterium Es71-Z0120]|uniref:fumarate hydratase n=1 Tax=Parvivirga hydrogeniphila TaxID=2939460 RepID=UPI002260EFBF|nr:fumarate hydratase [Parvivirga hydrogeniphila]MCL4079302.1 fumarate hydratase [Parvivirga hydrogeniphila]